MKWANEKRGEAISSQPRKRAKRGRVFWTGHSTRREMSGTCRCLECGNFLALLPPHLRAVHDMSAREYQAKYPGAPLREPPSDAANSAREEAAHRRYLRLSLCWCHGCGTQFRRRKRGKRTRYCTPTCANKYKNAAKRKTATTPCQACGKPFYAPPSQQAKYCSKACYSTKFDFSGARAEAFRARNAKDHADAVKAHTKTCPCGRTWIASRAWAVTCSPLCREKYHPSNAAKRARSGMPRKPRRKPGS